MCGLGSDVTLGCVDFGTCGLGDVDLGTMWTLGHVGLGTCGIGELWTWRHLDSRKSLLAIAVTGPSILGLA